MRSRILFAAVLATHLCTLILVNSARAASVQEVTEALDRGKAYLYAQQNKDGHWEEAPARDPKEKPWREAGGQWGGITALATYALLASGESPQDARLQRAIEFLKKAEMPGVYAISMRAQVWAALPKTPELRELIRRDANALRAMLKTKGAARGFFDYLPSAGDNYSHSRGNYGVLGMWALERAGIGVPNDFWQAVEEGWIAHQDPSGGWTYKAAGETDHPLTPGMTAAGVATLYITQDYLRFRAVGADCRPVQPSLAIDKGLRWLAEHFDKVATDDLYDRSYPYPTLYAIERVGVASGLRQIGEVDWYRRGADWLVARQHEDGSWHRSRRATDLSDACFAMLFLARGRAPLLMSKLRYGDDAAAPSQGDLRPRDAANLARWVSNAIERELNWQIITLDVPQEDLHEAPILYVTGRDRLGLSQEQRTRLRTFAEDGGLVMAAADCNGRGFATDIQALGIELFPAYRWRELPADHPIYRNQQFRREKWRIKPSVLGLSNGVRELMLLVPGGDPARFWHTNAVGGHEEFWQLAANVFQYVVDQRNLRFRGDSHVVARDESISPSKRVRLARLQYDGNWDPEPGGWRRLANLLHNGHDVTLDVTPIAFASQPLPDDVRIAHLTGTEQRAWTDAERAALAEFVARGGTLLVDSAGGSANFAGSAEALLAAIFPGAEPRRLTADDPLLRREGMPDLAMRYRPFARQMLGKLDDAPRLKAYERDGRVAALYSREDLSAGLVGKAVDGVIGYEPQTATDIMLRLILSARAD